MRRSRRLVPVILALFALLVAAPAASANLFEDLFKDYVTDGQLNACKYSEDELRQVKNLIPNDIEQYAPDFPAELDSAIERRASGACGDGGGGGGDGAAPGAGGGGGGGGDAPAPAPEPKSTPGVAQAPPEPAATPTPAPAVADRAIVRAARTSGDGTEDTPFPLLALALMGGMLVMAGILYGAARWWAWEPMWMGRARHATAEAGWRASSTWAEFTDFVRFGR